MEILNGALHEKPWSEINQNIRDNAVGYSHSDKALGNYVTPIDLQVASRFRDLDGDGQAQVLDKHFNVDVLAVDAMSSIEFDPRTPAEGILSGERVHTAAIFANTIDLYNPEFSDVNRKGKVVGEGYFKGTTEDPIVRFEKKKVDGNEIFALQVNDQYAHMGEEALRAVTMKEYYHFMSENKEHPAISVLNGLLAATASLEFDHSPHAYRDRSVFDGIIKHYNLPTELSIGIPQKLLQDEHHDYTGSSKLAKEWFDKLSLDVQEKLRLVAQ